MVRHPPKLEGTAGTDLPRRRIFRAEFGPSLRVGLTTLINQRDDLCACAGGADEAHEAIIGPGAKRRDGLVGQWQLAGTSIYQSGPPFTIEDSTFTAAVGGSARPNRIATGYDYSGTGRRGIDFNSTVLDHTLEDCVHRSAPDQ